MNNKMELLLSIITNLPSPEKEREFVRVVLEFSDEVRPRYLTLIK